MRPNNSRSGLKWARQTHAPRPHRRPPWLAVVRHRVPAGASPAAPVPGMFRSRSWLTAAFTTGQPYDPFLRARTAGGILAARDGRAANNKDASQEKTIAPGYLATA